MNLYYVNGTESIKKNGKEKLIADIRAVPAKDLDHLKTVCDESYVSWEFLRGPYKMSKYWD